VVELQQRARREGGFMKLGLRVLAALLPIASGCSWSHYATENLASAPVDCIQEWSFRHEIHRLANDAWRQIETAEPDHYSHAYAHGFKDGFVDYVEYNGTAEPPAMPPVKLQREGMRTPKAQQDIEDWFAGFRHGAHVARESGLRERFLVPIALPPQPVVGEPEREAMRAREAFPPMPSPVPPPAPLPGNEMSAR
jgi:hypothetical protein